MDLVDLEIGIFWKNQPAVGGTLVVERKIRDGREGRLECGKALQRRLWARVLFFIERQSAVLVKNRHEALAKITIGNRGRGPLLAQKCQSVGIFSANACR